MLYRPPTASASLPSQFSISARAEPENRKTRRRYRSSRRHFERGARRAVVHAFTAARLYLDGTFATLRAAAQACGANTVYTAAAIIILKTEDETLKIAILRGVVHLPTAAKAMKEVAALVSAYRAAKHSDKYVFARAISVGTVWDEMIAPVLDGDAGTNGKEVAAT
jgi:hypothetical protein